MSVFELEKIREVLSKYDRGELSNYNSDTLCAIKALRVMGKLCEEGRKLEAENADLKRQLRDALERC